MAPNKCAKRMEEEEDRISQLCVSVLTHILSFLPLKDAAATSILSKFWRRIWLFSEVFDFDAFQVFRHHPGMLLTDPPPHTPEHVKWISNVLRSHHEATRGDDVDNPFVLKKLQIHMRLYTKFQSQLDEWISYAFARRVQSLELDFIVGSNPIYLVVSPCSFSGTFAAKTDLTCLRSLSLAAVNITGEVINSLLCNFPFLESLKVCKSKVLRSLTISGSSLALKHLEISYCLPVCRLTVRDTSLVSLTITHMSNLVLLNNPKLVVVRNMNWILPYYALGQLKNCLSRLETFTFSTNYTDGTKVIDVVPQLSEVKQLSLNVEPLLEESLIRLTTLLSQSPKLEKLVLEFVCLGKKWVPCNKKGEVNRCPRFPHLKVVEVRGYDGELAEDKTLKYVLEHAVAPPEKIIFDPRNLRRDMYAPATRTRVEVETSEHVKRLKRVVPSSAEFIVV